MSTKGWRPSPEIRARMADAARRSWQNPAIRARREAGLRDPETLARNSEGRLGNTSVLSATVKGECVYCGQPATTTDHAIPREAPYGGADSPDNAVVACRFCNASKGLRDPWSWLRDGLYGRHPGKKGGGDHRK